MADRAEEAMRCGFDMPLFMHEGRITPKLSLPHVVTMKSRSVREDDIYVASYPKTGTHWVWEIANMIVAGKAEYARHWQNHAFLEFRSEKELDEIPSPRIFFTHMVPRQLPEEVWKRGCHVIHVDRNPKDAIVSFYVQQINQNWWHKAKPKAFVGTWDQYVHANIKGTVTFDSILDHVKAWSKVPELHPTVPYCNVHFEDLKKEMGARWDKSFTFDSILDHVKAWSKVPELHPTVPYCNVHFEDLKKDDVAQVRKLAEFLGRPLEEKVYVEIAKACRFDKLKHASDHIKDQTFHNKWNEGSPGYFRKGETGDWKNWFTVAQSEAFDRAYEQTFGQKFPY